MSERETALKEPCPHCGRTDYRWTQEFRVGLSFSPEDRLEVRCDYCRPLRMDAYYFGFTETGVLAIDRILSAVAQAGKGYHHTESWGEDGLEDMGQFYGGSYVAWIQNAANDAAKAFAALPVEGDAPQVCQWRELAGPGSVRRAGCADMLETPSHMAGWKGCPYCLKPLALVPAEGRNEARTLLRAAAEGRGDRRAIPIQF